MVAKKSVVVEKAATENSCDPLSGCFKKKCDGSGAFYGLGFIGAAIYYISVATGFWSGVLGVLKAIVWPVFLVHGLLKLIA